MSNPLNPVVRPLQVFLCHSKVDKVPVRNLHDRLLNEGFDPWLDEKRLVPGQDWKYEIKKAIRTTDAIIVCLSERSVRWKGFVNTEIREALEMAEQQPEGSIFIIPLKLDECQLPDSLNRYHCVALNDDHAYERLIEALKKTAESLKPEIQIEASPSPRSVDLIAALKPSWGVIGLELDHEAVKRGIVSLLYFRGVLPMNVQLRIPDVHPTPPQIDITNLFLPDRDFLSVFLACPTSPTSVRRCTLAVSHEAQNEIVVMEIGQIIRTGSGSFVFDPEFVPPCLTIRASERLMSMLGRLTETIEETVPKLSQRYTDYVGRTIRQSLFISCAEFRHFILTGDHPPEEVFVAMLKLAASLSALLPDTSPRALPLYDDNSIGRSFSLLDRHIRALVDMARPKQPVVIPLTSVTHEVCRGRIPSGCSLIRARLYLSIAAPELDNAAFVKSIVANVSVAGSVAAFEQATARAGVYHVPMPPAELPLKLNRQYFVITLDDDLRRELHAEREIYIFIPEIARTVEIDLLILETPEGELDESAPF